MSALIDLAVNSRTGHVALGNIAERNEISPQYLEQVFASLRRAGIVKSVKGSQGGYLLNREASKITVSSVVEALEGPYRLDIESAPEGSSYRGIADAIQTLLIERVNRELDDILTNLTLADLEQYYLDHSYDGQDMYYI